MMTLNLGLRAHDLEVQSIDQLGETVNQLSFRHIQFAPCKSFPTLTHDMLTAGFARRIQHQLKQQQIHVSVLGCYINMAATDVSFREKELATFVRYLRLAHDFGASVVATETGSVGNGYCLENFHPQAFERVVDAMQYLVVQAEKLGVTIALEAGINHPIYSAPKMIELLHRLNSNNIQLILDVANLITVENAHQQSDIIDEALTLYQDRLVAIHLKDFTVTEDGVKFVPFGQGELLINQLFSFIKQHKPGLYCLFENTKTAHITLAKQIAQNNYYQLP